MVNHRSPLKGSSRKVIIIGATSGIGRQLAEVFVEHGFTVAVSGRRNDLLLSLQKQFQGNILTECFDVTGKENIVHVQNMIDKLDGVDILIYCSGYGEISRQLDPGIEIQTTAVNVNGFVEIIAYAFNYFVAQGFGHVVGISSIASIRGNAHAPAYSASKAYQSNYLEGLLLKAKKLKVLINITDIQPGFVDTALAKGDGKFWVATPQRAARQIFAAIIAKKKVAYITKRWWLIAVLLKYIPGFIYRRIG